MPLVEGLEPEQVSGCLCRCDRAMLEPVDGSEVVIEEGMCALGDQGLLDEDVLMCDGAQEFQVQVCDVCIPVGCGDKIPSDGGREAREFSRGGWAWSCLVGTTPCPCLVCWMHHSCQCRMEVGK